MLFKFNISALILQCSFQGAGIQNQLLYHAEWSEKRNSTFFSQFSKDYNFKGVTEIFGEA